MANNVPIHNANIARLARLLVDVPVGYTADEDIAANNGAVFSSSFREQCMAKGYEWVAKEILKYVPDKFDKLMSGLLVNNYGTLTSSSGSTTLPKDYIYFGSLVRSTASTPPYRYVPPEYKSLLDMDNLPDAKRVFTISGGTIYSYTRTNRVLTADDSIVLLFRYYKRERINPSTGALIAANTTDTRSSDITLNSIWFEAATQYAAYVALTSREGLVGVDGTPFLATANAEVQKGIENAVS